jgi:hypothetical protein
VSGAFSGPMPHTPAGGSPPLHSPRAGPFGPGPAVYSAPPTMGWWGYVTWRALWLISEGINKGNDEP